MCGIVGFLDKSGNRKAPLGRTLLTMLQALSCRGPDSAGVALFGEAAAPVRLRLSVPPGVSQEAAVLALRTEGVTAYQLRPNGVHDAGVSPGADLAGLEERLRGRLPGAEVICLGESLELFKQVGSPDELEATYGVSTLEGSHGIGHTRLSTESRVDLSHSQPFWAHGVPDLATVHNGHITNYHKLRRRFEQQGYRFCTENDSEVIGVYLRDQLAGGRSLAGALRASLDDFDGSFSYLVASKDCLAYVKDRFGFKPLMLAETDDFVALATEEVALRRALGPDFVAREPPPGSLGLWPVNLEMSHASAAVAS